jgi:pimeloyl-ACP methyl ester carboxylesterase
MQTPDRSRTFVLVHGAWHGGWCFADTAASLRARGHRVFTPTQTGLGERAHLLSKSITLDIFIDDVANMLTFEDLADVVLVGHSFAGSTISGVADRMKEKLRCLVYLDALMIESGQTPSDQFPDDVREKRAKLAERSGGLSLPVPAASSFGVTDPVQAALLARKLTPHPYSTYDSPLRLRNQVANGVPATYIVCTDPLYRPLQPSRDWVKRTGMASVELATGHDAMISAPQALADLLEELAA